MPDRLHFTDSDEANELIASDPMALLVGFALDQQVTVQKAFAGPLALKERLGTLDAAALDADLEPIFRERQRSIAFPARWPRRCTTWPSVRDHYDGDAARVWTDASDSAELRANLAGLPGFGEMKVKALGSVLAKRFGIAAAQDLVPWHPTLGDVDGGKRSRSTRRPSACTRPSGRRPRRRLARAALASEPIAAPTPALTTSPGSPPPGLEREP